MVLEACQTLAAGQPVLKVELFNFCIHRALAFNDELSDTEILFKMADWKQEPDEEVITAHFSCSSPLHDDSGIMSIIFDGQVRVEMAEINRQQRNFGQSPLMLTTDMIDMDIDRFYSSLLKLEYGYTGPFRGLTSARRSFNLASGSISVPFSTSDDTNQFLIHPGVTDSAFHSLFAALSWPGDGRLWGLHVPTSIKHLTVDFSLLLSYSEPEMSFRSSVNDYSISGVSGDVQLLSTGDNKILMHVEGLTVVPFAGATSAEDRPLFANLIWGEATPEAKQIVNDGDQAALATELAVSCERVAFYYLRTLAEKLPLENRKDIEWHHHKLLDFVDHVMPIIASGRHASARKEWISDTYDVVLETISRFPDSIDVQLCRAVGENLPSVMRGESTMLEHMMEKNMLDRFYEDGMGVPKANDCLADLVAQLSHKNPHMRILEVGAGTGGVTKKIMKAVGEKFSLYTYTDISTGFFEQAQETFEDYMSKMEFKALDIEKDVLKQGYQKGSYDVIIASNVLHATRSMQETMSHVRSLLKPGGFLLLLEITTYALKLNLILGGLPGWWVGADDGRSLAPTMSAAQWETLLRSTGFSGIDTISHYGTVELPCSVFATQAVDDNINSIREPLSAEVNLLSEDLLIVGGKTSASSTLVTGIIAILGPKYRHVSLIKSIEDLDTLGSILPKVILSLADLDEPFFRNLTEKRLASAKKLFSQATSVVLVTQGRRDDNPYANMTVGLGRSLVQEMPQVRFQFFDIDEWASITPALVAETLLRFHLTHVLRVNDIVEPEITLEKNQLKIPRVVTNQLLNERLNSARRSINREVDVKENVVKLLRSEMSYKLTTELKTPRAQLSAAQDDLIVQVRYSTLYSNNVGSHCFMYLCVGVLLDSKQTVLAFTLENSSIVRVPRQWAWICDVAPVQQASLLINAAAVLMLRYVKQSILSGDMVVVNNAEAVFAELLSQHAASMGMHIIYTSSDRESPALTSSNIGVLVDLSIRTNNKKSLPVSDKNAFQPFQIWRRGEIFGSESRIRPGMTRGQLYEILQDVRSRTSSITLDNSQLADYQLTLDKVWGHIDVSGLPYILDWTSNVHTSVAVEPLKGEYVLSAEKTYVLFGMTGELGLSTCRWMVDNGARHVVLASRKPNVDANWLKMLAQKGADVRVLAVGIVNRDALREFADGLRQCMPPIGGLINGAMVFVDKSFVDMEVEDFERSLKPKVEGTMNLDNVFSGDHLDFFICFSSLVCVTGSVGQTNYTSANMFMTSFVAQCRKRGLVGSVVDIGSIMGIGFIRRSGNTMEDRMLTVNYIPISEADYHQILAETILASRPGSDSLPELMAGLGYSFNNSMVRPLWHSNPMFAHYIVHEKREDTRSQSNASAVSVKQQLQESDSEEITQSILETCFSNKLSAMLQLPKDSTSTHVPLVELGVDSLVAVRVRSWFIQELETDMPVLKVLGGGSIADLCADARERLPQHLRWGEDGLSTSDSSAETDSRQISVPSTVITTPARVQTPIDDKVSSIQAPPFHGDEITMPYKTGKISFSQLRFWFLSHSAQDKSTPNCTISFHMKGPIDVPRLTRAVSKLAERHDILRTQFYRDGHEPMFSVLRKSQLHLEHVTGDSESLSTQLSSLKSHIYDLNYGETMKIKLFNLYSEPNSHVLVFGYHHIILDGAGFQNLLSDLQDAYNGQVLKPIAVEFSDVVQRQREKFEAGDMEKDLKYWRQEFDTIPPTLPLLPFSSFKSRRVLTSYDCHRLQARIDYSLTQNIKRTSQSLGCTPFHFYLATLQALMNRLVDAEDICIGIADTNRIDADSLDTVGLLMNLLPLRLQGTSKQDFGTAAKRVRDKTYGALGHSSPPFEVVLDDLRVPRSTTESPLFQILVTYQMVSIKGPTLGECRSELKDYFPGPSTYDVALDIAEIPGESTILTFKMQKAIYDSEGVKLLMDSYSNLLETFSKRPTLLFEEPALFQESDIQLGIKAGQGAFWPSLWPETLLHQVEDIIKQFPNNTAVKDGLGHELTYRQLKERYNQVALALMQANVQPGDRVALIQKPSVDYICSILAIMHVGAVYVPLDLRHPIPRLQAIADDCQPALLLTDAFSLYITESLHVSGATVLSISEISGCLQTSPGLIQAKAESPFVILYTSGSTGKPKGIELCHRNIRNHVEVVLRQFKIGAEVILQQSSFGFDMSLEQIFCGIANGGCVFVASELQRTDPTELVKIIKQERITYTAAAASEYASWVRHGSQSLYNNSTWKYAFSGGEELTAAIVDQFSQLKLPQLRLFNMYGPTETSLNVGRIEIPYTSDHFSSQIIPVGVTLPNYSVYIMDKQLRPCPTGVAGEIVLGGAGTALGYVNEDALSRTKFLSDPFSPAPIVQAGWNRMYCTGDQGKLLANGTLLFLGRLEGDTQIKRNGVRIELADIESNILQTAGSALSQAIVSVRGNPEFLVAHVVFSAACQLSTEEKDQFLKKLLLDIPLPANMCPSLIVQLDQIPLSASGKVDRKAIANLPLPETKSSSIENDKGLTETGFKLLNIWKEIIASDAANAMKIEAETNFFLAGGNSLLLMQLQTLIDEVFGISTSLQKLLEASVFGKMVSYVEGVLQEL